MQNSYANNNEPLPKEFKAQAIMVLLVCIVFKARNYFNKQQGFL